MTRTLALALALALVRLCSGNTYRTVCFCAPARFNNRRVPDPSTNPRRHQCVLQSMARLPSCGARAPARRGPHRLPPCLPHRRPHSRRRWHCRGRRHQRQHRRQHRSLLCRVGRQRKEAATQASHPCDKMQAARSQTTPAALHAGRTTLCPARLRCSRQQSTACGLCRQKNVVPPRWRERGARESGRVGLRRRYQTGRYTWSLV